MLPLKELAAALAVGGALLCQDTGGAQDSGEEPIIPLPTEEGQVVSLTLDEAIRIALQRDIGLQIEELDTDVARFAYEGSWGAFDPVLTATASASDETFGDVVFIPTATQLEYSQTRNSLAADLLYPLTGGGNVALGLSSVYRDPEGSPPTTLDSIELAFTQPLLRGRGRDYATSTQRESEIQYQKQIQVHRQTRQDLVRNVEDAYWDLVAAIEQHRVARESLALAERQLDQNVRRRDAGVGTQVEVLQSEADMARQEEQLLLREVAVRDAEDALKARLFPGTNVVYWSAGIEPATPLPEIRTDDVPGWKAAVETALERRPELEQSRLEIDAADERLVRAASERKARLDLTLSTLGAGLDASSSEAFESALGWDLPIYSALLTYSLPLGNRAASNAERSARAGVRLARLVYDDLESTVVSEVRAAHRQVLYAEEVVQAAVKSVERSRAQLHAEEARFQEGLSTNFQVLEFQEDLALAQFAEVQGRTSFAKARTGLLRAQGLLGEVGE